MESVSEWLVGNKHHFGKTESILFCFKHRLKSQADMVEQLLRQPIMSST